MGDFSALGVHWKVASDQARQALKPLAPDELPWSQETPTMLAYFTGGGT